MNGRTVLSGIGCNWYCVCWTRSRAICLWKCTSVEWGDNSSIRLVLLLCGFSFRQGGGHTRPRLGYLVILTRDVFRHDALVMFMTPNDQINRIIE